MIVVMATVLAMTAGSSPGQSMEVPFGPVWADQCNVPGIFSSGQETCDARTVWINWPRTLQYFATSAFPLWVAGGECRNIRDGFSDTVLGYPREGYYCSAGYRMVGATDGTCLPAMGDPTPAVYSIGASASCTQTTEIDPGKTAGPPCCYGNASTAGGTNPINLGTGNKYQGETDYVGSGADAMRFVRSYNSVPPYYDNDPRNLVTNQLHLGSRWTHNFSMFVDSRSLAGRSTTTVRRPDGRSFSFNLDTATKAWVPDADISDRFIQLIDAQNNFSGWRYTTRDDDVEVYNTAGHLLSITNRAGNTRTLTYSDFSTPPNVAPLPGLLILVTDAHGRELDFTYNAQARIATMRDSISGQYMYSYDGNNNLTGVTYPDSRTRSYIYNEQQYTSSTNLPNALTGIIDENAQRFAIFNYDAQARATSSEHSGGVDKISLSYGNGNTQTSSTDSNGMGRSYTFSILLGVTRTTGVSQPCASCGDISSAITYDVNGNVSSRTDFNNKKVCYAYDLTRNLETARLEGALSSEDCATVLASPPNRPDVRKITTTWNASYRLPATMVEPAAGGTKTTTFTYDPSGNLTQKSIVAPANDGTGNNVTRSWSWTYATLGRVLTAADPDSHTTTTTYYADNDPDLGKRGNVATITNAASHITQITAYDLNSRPLSISDPNGLVTTLTYHPRGWLTSRQVGAELTTYDYDGVGQLTKVTQPDGSYLQYTYDAAHRLTQINDSLNNRIAYTLDAMGNRIKEEAFDPSNTLSRTRQQVFDSLNRLHQTVGAQ
jgi:YD repeat-containing protein